jgi:broad specificity phosphatase PhoE
VDTTIYLIRHGAVNNPKKVVYGKTADAPLSDEGKNQIKLLAEKFKKDEVIPFIILSSPLKRAVESTEIIHNVFNGTPVLYEKGLTEVDMGLFVGKLMAFRDGIGDFYHAKEYQNMRVERPEAIVRRMYHVIHKILNTYRGKTVFLVGHDQPIEFLIWKLEHPSEDIASIVEVKKRYLMLTGQAWKIILSFNATVVEKELIKAG